MLDLNFKVTDLPS